MRDGYAASATTRHTLVTGHERQRQAPARWPATLLRGGVPRVRTRRAAPAVRKRGRPTTCPAPPPAVATSTPPSVTDHADAAPAAPESEGHHEQHELVVRDPPDPRRS